MAIFNTPKKKSAETKSGKPLEPRSDLENFKRSDFNAGVSSVLLRPRITEKASMLAEKNTYVFEVHPKANKKEVAAAIMNAYKVTPARVHIVNLPAKKVFSRGKKGMQSGLKKAIVYLKHGDKIEFV